MIGFSESSYSATEGNSMMFVLELTGEAEKEVTVEFSTSDDTATGVF